ncbi:MAG: hypothetical protein ACF8CQ_19750, partial [Rhodopirellula sp. JB044]
MSPPDRPPSSDAAAKRVKSSVSPPRHGITGSQIWISLISTIVLGGLLVVVIRSMGFVQGEEFSPSHFRSRTFSFYEIPLIHWQITPIQRKSTTPSTAVLLTQKKWVSPPSDEPRVWHLVSLRRGLEESHDDDAALLLS